MASETLPASGRAAIYVVEHLDPELGPWSALEYACIARESYNAGAQFVLSSVPTTLQMPRGLASTAGLQVEHRSVEEIFAHCKANVCLLDPAAETELSPEDGDLFSVFLFGGILGAHWQSSSALCVWWLLTKVAFFFFPSCHYSTCH